MRALTVEPGVIGSARLDDVAEPADGDGDVLVRALDLGICGTDAEITSGQYGTAPPGQSRLVIGHESLGEVLEAPTRSDVRRGDLVVPIVRRPDPVPCIACADGEWDMCRNGLYTERGIKARDGFGSERYRCESAFLVPVPAALREVGVLVEPTSVVAKAWKHIERIGSRAAWQPRRVLVTGAGPIGLLAALLATQRGLDVDVLDIVTDGPKPDLVRDLGATYHCRGVAEVKADADIVIECTGVGQLVFDVMSGTARSGIVCLTGVSSGGRDLGVDVGALNRSMVLENDVVFGSVNANRRHYEDAVTALVEADQRWLSRLISRRVLLDDWASALERSPHDVKVAIDFEPA